MKLIHIHPIDNVVVALDAMAKGEQAQLVDGQVVTAGEEVPRGHKVALKEIKAGEAIMKYGCAIGTATRDILPGEWVHTHNVKTGLSGITANPTVGRFSDRLIAMGGTTILTEVPEMFGAEGILFDRCANQGIFDRAVDMVEKFKKYFTDHGQVVYENPSPGNKAGGITTLEDKFCGCVQKGGLAQIVDVLEYGDQVTTKGLNLLSGPGNDLVSATVLTAAGAHMVLFTIGRGTPFGAPAPTVKISTNTPLFEKKGRWIDFNAGTVAQGEPLDEAGARLLDYVLEVASGKQTRTEEHGYREISIFKDGVVL